MAKTESNQESIQDSDFESFIIQFESDSDELLVKIPATEYEYPVARPVTTDKKLKFPDESKLFDNWDPNTASDDAINEEKLLPITQADLDSHARKAPRSTLNRFEDLISYLDMPAQGKESRDDIMVRAILVWLSNQEVESSHPRREKIRRKDFSVFLGKNEAHTLHFYSTLQILYFNILIRQIEDSLIFRKADIPCVRIHGVCKAGEYQPGDRNGENLGCLWNAVYLRDSWHIIHPFWACRSVFGKKTGGWIRLEEDGKFIGKQQASYEGVLKNAFEEYYIMPVPKHFLYECHPDESNWQLVSKPISRDKFFDQAYLLPPFWALGLTLLSENSCSLKSVGNPVTITFQGPKKTANELNTDYDLLLKEDSAGERDKNKMLKPENMPRLVAKIRNGSEWNFNIQFPVEGIYRIVIYGAPEKQPLLRLCEFQIRCTTRTQNCRLTPFNPGMLGFGPSLTSERAGLLLPSHRNGLVTTDKNKPTKLSFLLDSEMSKSMEVRTELVDSDNEDQSSLVVTTIEKKELKITTTLIKEEITVSKF
ncbi:unnamed protein product [Mytilus edulis]|uniref:KY-like immunoglobulin-like domain-containing protein n=1 Tax=Mytilus edulis TaxID=6550 RepID=A0A8S3TIM0_MYTED|nr:unnamed protein product [Mytilus edulis]